MTEYSDSGTQNAGTNGDSLRAAAALEAALLFTIIAHAAAMLTMAVLLIPGIPGGSHAEIADRAAHVAAHPWLWRLGWLPWQVTAASDVLLSIALLRTPWIPRLPALVAAIATVLAVFADQIGQIRWTWEGVTLAQATVTTGDLDA